MAQIIKHRRGTAAQLKTVTLAKGEIGVSTGSVAGVVTPVVHIGDGANAAGFVVGRLFQGSTVPTLTSGDIGSSLNDMLFHDSAAYKLYKLNTGGNENLDLTGNIANRAVTGSLTLTGAVNIEGAATSTAISASGEITASNIYTSGDVRAAGTVTFGTLSDGTIGVTAWVDEDNMASNSATLIPTQQSVKAYVDTNSPSGDLDFQGDSGGVLSINLDSETLDIAGDSAGITTVGSGNQITISGDHDSLTNFVANEHIDHSGVTLTAGAGLSGGGTIAASRTFSVDSGSMSAYYSSSAFSKISGDIVIAAGGVATIQANSIVLATDTTGDYVQNVTAGTGLTSTGATSGENIAHSLSVDASQTQITSVGTIGTGTWEGTTIAVAQGGTGATTLNNLITLADHTTGNYVGTVTGGTGLTSTGATSGEGIAHSLSVDAAQTQITSVGALDAGSITSNFGSINNGASAITTTGLISGGSLDIDDVVINGTTIGHTDDTDLMTVANGKLTISGNLDVMGTTTFVSSSQVEIGDRIIELNATNAAGDGGIYVRDTDTAETGSLLWDVSEDRWIAGLKDAEINLVTISSTDTLTNKTLTTPTIASFTNATHTHANAAGGGQITLGTGTTGNYVATAVAGSGIDVSGATGNVTISIGTGEVVNAMIGDDEINSEHYAAGSIDNEHLADDAVDSDELAAGAVDDDHLSDGVATGLAGTGITATSGVLNVIGGTGITANANEITTTDGDIVHDNLSGFVANEHIDHSGVTLTAGTGLSGGGTIAASRTFSVDSGSMSAYYSSSAFSKISGDILIAAGGAATIQANSVALSTDTTGNYTATITAGTGLTSTGATSGEGIAHSISVDASQTQITGIGTITTGVWNGTSIGTTYTDAKVTSIVAGSNISISGGTGAVTITGTDTNTTYTGGTNLTLAGTTFNVDDAFLKNNANDETSGTITAAGLTTSGNISGSATSTGSFGHLIIQTGTIDGGSF